MSIIMEKITIVNWHYFKVMTINNYATNGHQIEMYCHAYPTENKNEI